MSDPQGRRIASLGEVEPGRSRHAGRRSTVAIADDAVVAGTAAGGVLAFDRALVERWRAEAGDAGLVASAPVEGGVAVGERGPAGEIRVHDADGCRWRYRTADDVGDPQRGSRFLLPFVASIATDDDHLYAAARRYERTDGDRSFESVVYAFDDGGVDWRYRTDASPIAVETDGDRLAVAYNRCPGSHQRGLVVLDATTGTECWAWDPGTDGQRRVGDVSLARGDVFVASHGDYRGYCLTDGEEQWAVSLGRPETVGGERVYTYPNHVHATAGGAYFVTGNTYPAEGRQTDARHPGEHTVTRVETGDPQYRESVGGFVTGLGTDGATIAVPCAQHFRDRDADGHGLSVFDASGRVHRVDTDGVVTAAAIDAGLLAAVEEPVVYHDEGCERGAYRLHAVDI